jgi:hypothetical protein
MLFKNSVRTSKSTTLHHYRDQLVKAVYGNKPCLQLGQYKTHKYKKALQIVRIAGTHNYHYALKGQVCRNFFIKVGRQF